MGANCTIVCGVKIGNFALIGAGAVVTKNDNYGLYVGVPAKSRMGGKRNKIRKNLICPDTNEKYILKTKIN